MPRCWATERASYTSSSEQHRPVAPSFCNSGRRRWFHNCIVKPTALRPPAFTMAATTEESTPPLIATAIRLSDMGAIGRRQTAEMRGGVGHSSDQLIHLLLSIPRAQGKTHAALG